jgi:hypothetical protein
MNTLRETQLFSSNFDQKTKNQKHSQFYVVLMEQILACFTLSLSQFTIRILVSLNCGLRSLQ